ncbi:plasmid mobilization relaxosome protein MobC [Zestomonas carbonaria]|uniref:plasmid mobilization relaxosome protein MobC n=1 Tax=Zestomonas carbonaria TaxID=2762745 RepID=UPI001656FA7F|nr:plasmid mobilization relaxosome protein MobC [Pseudomonas carbonaria]
MPIKTATLITRIGRSEKSQFERTAKSQNLTPSELLRRLVLAEIGKNEALKAAEPVPERIGTERLTIALAEFLMDSVKLRAEAKGMATSRWISALVQSHVSNAPVATEKEVLMLRAMVRELSAIGRNINQIARHLNSTQNYNKHVDLDALSKLPTSIENTKQGIRTVIRATCQSWGVEG